MRNSLFILPVVLLVALGCGLVERVQRSVSEAEGNGNIAANVNANKTITEKAVDTAVGEEKIGIPECDEALDLLMAQTENPDDNFIVKAGKKTMVSTFRDQIKKNLEENKADKKEVAKMCTEFKKNLEDSLSNSNTSAENP